MDFFDEIDEVLDLINEVEGSHHENIDGKALSCSLDLVYLAGLRKKEIPTLTIGDIFQGNSVLNQIAPSSGRNISLSEDIRAVLYRYRQHLQSVNYPVTPSSPLFPDYSGNSGEKKLDRHLKKFSNLN